MVKKLILSKNLVREPHVKVLQKLKKYVFIDHYQKLTNQTKIGANNMYTIRSFSQYFILQLNVRVFQNNEKYFLYAQD
jgi:hypothetical protein